MYVQLASICLFYSAAPQLSNCWPKNLHFTYYAGPFVHIHITNSRILSGDRRLFSVHVRYFGGFLRPPTKTLPPRQKSMAQRMRHRSQAHPCCECRETPACVCSALFVRAGAYVLLVVERHEQQTRRGSRALERLIRFERGLVTERQATCIYCSCRAQCSSFAT